MRVGLISDVHGNFVALDACLSRLAAMQPGRIYFLGDAVGYFPGEAEVLARLDEHGVICQRGNHDEMLLDPKPPPEHKDQVCRLTACRRRMGSAALAAITSWPRSRAVTLGQRKLLLVHGSPDDVTGGYVYPDADLSTFAHGQYDAIFMGNTHLPFVRHTGDTLVANVGAVGEPRDQGDLASFALYDSELHTCDIFRVRLDTDRIVKIFGAHIHESVRACLERVADSPFGEVLP